MTIEKKSELASCHLLIVIRSIGMPKAANDSSQPSSLLAVVRSGCETIP